MPIRKRLLGFAFASSDLLIELAPDGRVTMALGSGPGAGAGPETFQGQLLSERVGKVGAKALGEMLATLKSGARAGPIKLVMSWGDGLGRRASLRAFMLPELAPNISCSLSYDGPAFQLVPADAPPIMLPGAFLSMASGLLAQPPANDEAASGDKASERLSVSFIDIGGLSAAGKISANITARVEAALQAASVGGASAARLTAERYALMRNANDTRDIAGEVRELGHDEGVSLTVQSNDNDLGEVDPLNALLALRFAVEECIRDSGKIQTGQTFNDALTRTFEDAQSFRNMVRNRSFALHYQPIVDLKTGAVHHFEALARFKQDASPAETIRMAEEMALIEGFDLAVAEKAVQRLKQPGSRLLKIAINVSGVSLSNDTYVQSLLRLTAAKPEDRKRLIVEVTESAALADIDAANRRLQALKAVGMKLCIDDFGAGSASLDYIRNLSVDTVKIDGKFIQGLEKDKKAQTLITHLVEMCSSMNLTTIAEMIETQAAADILKSLGVDYGQGWLYGRAEAEPRTTLASAPVARRRGAVEAWG